MLNVSCSKQTLQLLPNSVAESQMEVVGELKPSEACNLLGVPGLSFSDTDKDEAEIVTGIRLKSSPLLRRRSSDSDDDSGPEPPPCGSRRVSFADAKGLSLVCVKEFATWDVPKPTGYDLLEGTGKKAEEYYLSILFPLPLSSEELLAKVQQQKVELETVELLPGTTTLKGVIRVLNISFDKTVYIRTTLDAWASHFDLLAEYIPGSSNGVTDGFSFKLTLVPPFSKQGARVDFCLRYETPVGTFWASNDNSNYALLCHQRAKEVREKPIENICKKSCLKVVSLNFNIQENQSSLENVPTGVSTHMEMASKEEISDSQSGPLEGDSQKVKENSRNCRRRSRQRAARLTRARDHFAQRDEKLTNTECQVSLSEKSLSEKEEDPLKIPSNVSGTSMDHSKVGGSKLSLESPTESNQTSPGASASNKSEKPEHIAVTVSVSFRAENTPASPNETSHSHEEESSPPACQHISEYVSKAEESRYMESSRVGEDEQASHTAGESKSNATPVESPESPDCQAKSFTFATVVAPLYHQVFGQMGSERKNFSEQRSMRRFNLENSSQTEIFLETTSAPMSLVEVVDPIETHESHQGFINHKKRITNVSADTSSGHLEIRNIRKDSDVSEKCPRDILDPDVLTAPVPRVSLHLQEITLEDNLTQGLQCNKQQLDTTTASSSSSVNSTLSQITTQVDPTCIVESLSLQPQVSQILSVPATADSDQKVNRGVAIDGESVDDLNETDYSYSPVSASMTTAHSEQDQHIDVMQNSDADHIIFLITAEDENTSAGNQNISLSPESMENKQIIKKDLSITTCQTLAKIDPNNVEETNIETGNSRKNELKHSADKEGETEVCSRRPAMKEPCQIKKMNTKREEFNPEQKAEERNWEKMVEEEEEDMLQEDEGNGELDEKHDIEVNERAGCGSIRGLLEGNGTEQVEMEIGSIDEIENKISEEVVEKGVAVEERESGGGVVGVKGEEIGVKEERLQALGEESGDTEPEMGDLVATQEDKATQEKVIEQFAVMGAKGDLKEEDVKDLEKPEYSTETLQDNNQFAETPADEEKESVAKMETDINKGEGDTSGYQREENTEEVSSDYDEKMVPGEAGEVEIGAKEVTENGGDIVKEERKGKMGTQNKKADLFTLVSNVHEGLFEKAIANRNRGEEETGCGPNSMLFHTEGGDQSNTDTLNGQLIHYSERDELDDSSMARAGSCTLTDEPEIEDSSSTGSQSDDEVELYMRCLRVVERQSPRQAPKDHSKRLGLSTVKRSSIGRSKQQPLSMPSIRESTDEEQLPGSLQDKQQDITEELQPVTTPFLAAVEQEGDFRNVAWWKETFSCSNITKTVLYTALLALFLAVAYHYDFLACFALYLISVFWLCCQGDKQPGRSTE